MARVQNKLTDASCKALRDAGMHSDGGGLYLAVKASGSKSWAFIWKKAGKRREMGLGSYPAVRLARARSLANECREAVAEGRDPIAERHQDAEPTFGDCADQFLESMESQWRNDKHRAQWKMTLTHYAAALREKQVSEIDTGDVLAVLKPIWATKPETASRLRGRIERVLDYAKVRAWRTGENPALWRGHLKNVLPQRQQLTRGHHAAMPHDEVAAFVARLQALNSISARGLEFLILTAARTGEVRGATWAEMDLKNAVWIIPAARMKAGREHRVPLTSRAVEIVEAMKGQQVSDFVFAGQKAGAPLSVMAFDMLMRRMQADAFTVHGFRSAFRDWVGDKTHFPREVAEAALAHTIGDATERAYRRGDALEKRRALMEAWAQYCSAGPSSDDSEG